MRVAALDFGSNTTLMLICDIENGAITKVLADETRITKMGQGVHQSRRLHPEALSRIKSALEDYHALIKKHKVDRVYAVATSAARDVENSSELFALAEKFEINIDVISGTREAELTYLGAFAETTEPPNCCVIDIGGGSTEIISRRSGKIVGESVDVGSVRLMDIFGDEDPMPQSKLQEMQTYIKSKMNPNWASLKVSSAIGVAGTPTILACMEGEIEFKKDQIDGMVLNRTQIKDWVNRLRPMSLEEREKIPGLPAKRADVILAGTVILSEMLDHLKLDQIQVSTYGVRYGVALAYSQSKSASQEST